MTLATKQQGFTLIELIVVIVILGILAATALPKFINVKGDAETAALSGVVGAMGAAMSVNFAGCLVANHVAIANKCVAVVNCTDVTSILQGGAVTGYTVTGASLGAAAANNGEPVTCTVTQTSSAATKTFVGLRTGPD